MDSSPNIAIFKGMPRFPVFPIIAATVAMEYSFLSSNSFFAISAEMIKTSITIKRYIEGAKKSVASTGRIRSPQNVRKTCRK